MWSELGHITDPQKAHGKNPPFPGSASSSTSLMGGRTRGGRAVRAVKGALGWALGGPAFKSLHSMTSCLASDKTGNLSESWFPHLQNGTWDTVAPHIPQMRKKWVLSSKAKLVWSQFQTSMDTYSRLFYWIVELLLRKKGTVPHLSLTTKPGVIDPWAR